MGPITSRNRKDNSTAYTAQIRINRDGMEDSLSGKPTLRPQAGRPSLDQASRDGLAEPGAIERANRKGLTIKRMIEQYLEEYEKNRPLGKTKSATLSAIKDTWLGELDDSALTSQKLVEFAQWRMSKEGGGVQAQTVGYDLSHLGAVLSVARPAWGYEVDPLAMPDARKVLRKLGMVSKSKERNRRPTFDELDKLMKHFFEMQARRKDQAQRPAETADRAKAFRHASGGPRHGCPGR